MENSFQTSFIPKKPIGSSSSRFKEPVSIFLIIPILILVISVVASIFLLVYKGVLVKQESSLSASLLSMKDNFEQNTIKELTNFDNRTKIAKNILSNHMVFSPMFKLLGDLTVPFVQYKKFDQKIVDKVSTVNIEGIAKDYKSIAVQADAFNSKNGSSFKNVTFSNILKDKNNNITFKLSFNVDSNLLSYEKNNMIVGQTFSPSDMFIPTTSDNLLLDNVSNKLQ